MKLLSFEIKKIGLHKKALFFSIILVIFAISLFVRNLSMQSFIKNEETEKIESHVRGVYQNIDYHTIRLKTNPNNEKDKQLLAMSSLMKDNLFEMRTASISNDWKAQMAAEIAFLMQVKDYKDEGGFFPIKESELHQRLFLQKELLGSSIPPQHDKYSIAFPNFVKQVVDLYANSGVYMLMLLLIGGILATEFEQYSIRMLYTQPVKRSSILWVKFMASVLLYVGMTGVVLIVAAGIGFFFGHEGVFDYPVVIQLNDAMHVISISQYILYSLVIMTAIILLGLTVCILYSLFFRSTKLTILGLLVTFAGGYMLTKSLPRFFTSIVNPFRPLLPKNVILEQNIVLWYQGIPAVLFCAVLIYLVALKKMKAIKTI